MKLVVHTVSGAPRGWRVLIGLTLKQLPYEVRYLQAARQEHKSEAFLKLNPRGTVPVLQADQLIIADSLAGLAWLDRQFPARPIFGNSAGDAADIWRTTTACCDYLRQATDKLLAPVLVQNIELPEPGSEQMASLRAAGELMQRECHWLEQQLREQPYLCAGAASAAEAVAYPEIRLLQRAIDRKHEIMAAAGFSDLSAQYPNLSAWIDRVGSLDGMDKTQPIHW